MGYEQFNNARGKLSAANAMHPSQTQEGEQYANKDKVTTAALSTLQQILKPDAVTPQNAYRRAKLFSRIVNGG